MSCTPASAASGLAITLGRREPLCDGLRLSEVFGCRAPEEQASEHFSDRQRYPECCGYAEDAVFHRGEACPLRKREARRRAVERLNFFLEGVIQLRVHPGAAAHAAGFVYGHVFELER